MDWLFSLKRPGVCSGSKLHDEGTTLFGGRRRPRDTARKGTEIVDICAVLSWSAGTRGRNVGECENKSGGHESLF